MLRHVPPFPFRASRRACVLLALAVACGGGSDGGSPTTPPTIPPPATGAITLTVASPNAALTVGGTTTLVVSVARSGGFAGAVTLNASGLPAGVSSSFSPSLIDAAQTSSVLTLSAGSSATAGVSSLTISASGTGVGTKSSSVQLSVTAPTLPVGFALTVDPVEFELPAGRGWTANGIISIARTAGFTGAVNVTISSLGTVGLIGASPSVIAANASATNALAVSADGAAPGVYTATVRATAAGFAEQSAPIRLRISPPSTGNIVWRFCGASRVPRFFAVRDGTGAWRHIVPDGPAAATAATPTTFSFTIGQSIGSVAMIGLGEKTSSTPLIEGHDWRVLYMTRAEIVDAAAQECVRNPDATTRTATATVSGYQSFDLLLPSAGSNALANIGSTGPLSTSLSLRNLQTGPFDLLISRSTSSGGLSNPFVVQSVVLRRALDPASGAALAPINFATEAFAPAVGNATFGNAGSETFFMVPSLITAAGLNGQLSTAAALTPTSRPWYGVPVSRLVAGDLHQLVATTNTAAARRAIIVYSREVGTRTFDFGAPVTPPTMSAGANGLAPWIVRATGTLSSDYTLRASLYLRENVADPRTMTIVASRGWLGAGAGYDIAVPDLAAAVGFTSFWNFRNGSQVRWTFTGGVGDPGGPMESMCMISGICAASAVDGAVYKSAQATGTITVP